MSSSAQLRDQYGNPIPLTDQYGNPVILTDERGNPVQLTGVATTANKSGTATTMADLMATQNEGREFRRSSSSSSSSSEDDGQGGRRKKGLKDKIKEKIPGVGAGNKEHPHTTTTAPTTTIHPDHQHEKKGIMEKIKEKLPGHHTTH